MSSSPLVAALDPRVDEQVVQEQMVQDPAPANPEPEPVAPAETVVADELDSSDDRPAPDISGGRP